MALSIVLVLVGLGILTGGGELLLRGATGLARRFGLSELFIGLTIVSFGTSAPEAAVTVSAALAGKADIVLGNVIGSNLFNMLAILGLCVVVTNVPVSRSISGAMSPR